METPSHMIVQLREIPCHRSVDVDVAFVRDAIAELPMRAALEAPAEDPDAGEARAELDFYMEGQNVFVRGSLRGWVRVACSRCVQPVRVDVNEELALTYLPRHAIPEDAPEEGEVELTEDDLDLFPYDGQEIDLSQLLREHVIMAVPFAPLCAEACKGLCPSCGIDLNHETCDCEAPIDPRLAALKDIEL